jgi:sugar (pentulose or hexulose) kinase
MGTSGWVSTVVDKSIVDANAMIAAIVGAQPGLYNYFAELETAGKCLEWVKNHLALDEIGIYLKKTDVAEDMESEYLTNPELIHELFHRRVDMVVDGGIGEDVPSTVVDCSNGNLEVVRYGKGEIDI